MKWKLKARRRVAPAFNAACDYLESCREGLGKDFSLCYKATVQSIQQNPKLHPKIRGEVRRAVVKRFPYSIFYLLESDPIVILTVIHQRRDPAVWQSQVDN